MTGKLNGLNERIVGWITLQIGGWYMRKRARELAPKVAAGAAVVGAAVLVLGAWEAQNRRSRVPTV
ncbi:MAG TPA: hypothetical protein VII98_12340 [Solirubrobacteraceae bacterium]